MPKGRNSSLASSKNTIDKDKIVDLTTSPVVSKAPIDLTTPVAKKTPRSVRWAQDDYWFRLLNEPVTFSRITPRPPSLFYYMTLYLSFKDILTWDHSLGKRTWKWTVKLPSTILKTLIKPGEFDLCLHILHRRRRGCNYEFSPHLFQTQPLKSHHIKLSVDGELLEQKAESANMLHEWFYVLIITTIHALENALRDVCAQAFAEPRMESVSSSNENVDHCIRKICTTDIHSTSYKWIRSFFMCILFKDLSVEEQPLLALLSTKEGLEKNILFQKLIQLAIDSEVGGVTHQINNTCGNESAAAAYLNDNPIAAFRLILTLLQQSKPSRNHNRCPYGTESNLVSRSSVVEAIKWRFMVSCQHCGKALAHEKQSIDSHFILDSVLDPYMAELLKEATQHNFACQMEDGHFHDIEYSLLPANIYQVVVSNNLATAALETGLRNSSIQCPMRTIHSNIGNTNPTMVITFPQLLIFERQKVASIELSYPNHNFKLSNLLNVQEKLTFAEFPGASYDLKVIILRTKSKIGNSHTYHIATKTTELGSDVGWYINHGVGNHGRSVSEEEEEDDDCDYSAIVSFEVIDKRSASFVDRIHLLYYELRTRPRI